MRRTAPCVPIAAVLVLLGASAAVAQPQLAVTPTEVPSGGSVTATITAPGGNYYVLLGSARDSGLTYGGVALGVGTDVALLSMGVVGPGGSVAVPVTPPLSAGLDVYYLLAVISPAPDFLPPSQSSTVGLRPRGLFTNAPVFPQGLNAGGARITNVATPSAGTDAATKSYVDVSSAILGAASQQSLSTSAPLINLQQTGSGDLLSLRTNSATFPGANGSSLNGVQFRVLPDGGLVAKGQITLGVLPATGAGWRMMWYPAKVAFRAGYADAGGQFDDANIGYYSWAGGALNTAAGNYSFAMGNQNTVEAGAQCGIALGSGNVVWGSGASYGTCGLALGLNNDVMDQAGVALGQNNTSDGDAAVAIGYTTTADADYSMAFGYRADTNGHTGAKVFSDASTTTPLEAAANNEFLVRAAGGYRFRTNATLTTGCNLPAGSGVFSCASDRNLKEHFEPVDGELLLRQLAAIPIERWSYKSEPGVRHMGPVAQDFKAAFDLGVNDISIGHLDEAGVSLRAIQALEVRTRELRDKTAEIDGLKAEIAELRRLLAAVTAQQR
jgi:hypothetical protein